MMIDRIVDGYENYFNFINGKRITSIKDLDSKETEWVDMYRGTTMIIFGLEEEGRMKVEIHTIRHMLIDKLLIGGFLKLLGHEVEFYIEEEERLHSFFSLLEEIKYFDN